MTESIPIIPYQRRWRSANEDRYVAEALRLDRRQGGGPFTKDCHALLASKLGAPALLTQSCTAALEFAGLLLDIGPGSEVILPSYTFTSTGTAFAVRGAQLVFVDIDPDTQNVDPACIEAAISERTKAIVVMHYAGVACDMPAIEAIARARSVPIIEDAAHAIGAFAPDGRALGAIGALGAFSFHDTKNVSCGEGGALVLKDAALRERADVMWEKGTDRTKFLRRQIDKYTWVDIGSSFLPSEISAAMLKAQLEEVDSLNQMRVQIWDRYHEAFGDLERNGAVRLPVAPVGSKHNAHLYYLMADDIAQRDALIQHLYSRGVQAVFHYVPLHDSQAGRRFGRAASSMKNTRRAADCLLRIPLWPGLTDAEIDQVISAVRSFYGR